MRPDEHDLACLWDMLDAALAARRYADSVTYESYLKNDLLRSGVQYQLLVIGEAVGSVSDAFKKAHPEIPWRDIVSQRNFLVHVYDGIDDEKVWQVITVDLPALVATLRAILPSVPE